MCNKMAAKLCDNSTWHAWLLARSARLIMGVSLAVVCVKNHWQIYAANQVITQCPGGLVPGWLLPVQHEIIRERDVHRPNFKDADCLCGVGLIKLGYGHLRMRLVFLNSLHGTDRSFRLSPLYYSVGIYAISTRWPHRVCSARVAVCTIIGSACEQVRWMFCT